MTKLPVDPVTAPYEASVRAATNLRGLTGVDAHDLAVVLGSGWAEAAPALGRASAQVTTDELGGFPPTGVEGHQPVVASLEVAGRRVLLFHGRVHLYEGHHPNQVVHGVRTAIAAGCRTVVLTNAAGSLRPDLAVGRPVLIADHLNLTGHTPLLGPHDARLGPRFPDLTAAYPPELRARVRAVAPELAEAVYAGFLGPAYETPAEVRMAGALGADLVGMSTVLETIAAVHAGASVVGLSLVTNQAAGLDPAGAGLAHHDVLSVAAAAAPDLGDLLARVVAAL
jgi:purine-nucleoside phosphorylase